MPSAALSLVLAFAAPMAVGQPGAPAGYRGLGPPLRPVDPTVEDVGPLGVSLRQLRPDLRQPLDFDRVYEIQADGRPTADRYTRMSGAVAAVFPRSQYTTTRNGIRIDVPAGTIFYLGGVPGTSPNRIAMPQHTWTEAVEPDINRLDRNSALDGDRPLLEQASGRTSVADNLRRTRPGTVAIGPQPLPDPSLFGNAQYRATRLRGLIRVAMEAHAQAPR